MAIEITTPQIGTAKKAAKDLVISSLLIEHPLTLAKLTNSIKKKFSASVTFQGVRRAVNLLLEDGVLEKQGKEYSISKDYILELREFVERLHNSYFAGRKTPDVEALGENVKVYTFSNLIELDKFWNDVIQKWFEDDADNKNPRHYVQQSGHTWYVLGQMGEETHILEYIQKYKIKFYTLANGDTFLDKWCRRYYEDQGFFYTTNNAKKKKTNDHYFAIYNDFIIQTTYPNEITKEIDEVYNKATDFESFDATKLIRLLRKKIKVEVTVMRNAVVAEQLRKFILSHFK